MQRTASWKRPYYVLQRTCAVMSCWLSRWVRPWLLSAYACHQHSTAQQLKFYIQKVGHSDGNDSSA